MCIASYEILGAFISHLVYMSSVHETTFKNVLILPSLQCFTCNTCTWWYRYKILINTNVVENQKEINSFVMC